MKDKGWMMNDEGWKEQTENSSIVLKIVEIANFVAFKSTSLFYFPN